MAGFNWFGQQKGRLATPGTGAQRREEMRQAGTLPTLYANSATGMQTPTAYTGGAAQLEAPQTTPDVMPADGIRTPMGTGDDTAGDDYRQGLRGRYLASTGGTTMMGGSMGYGRGRGWW
jgi:hypothetical protein